MSRALLATVLALEFAIYAVRINAQESDPLVVSTASGKVRGLTLLSDTNRPLDAWLGVPYAQNPTGNRFRPSKAIGSWSGIYNATSLPNACMQKGGADTYFPDVYISPPLSEDCLYLSVWVPRPRPEAAAVMVWVYGGGFQAGTHTMKMYDPNILVSENNVIVVGIQYRVGYFGFMHFGTEDVPGNVGLLDQVLAIRWVHENIRHFGGDPGRVTLFGESAGSTSISMHILSPLSRGLFSQAILESGVPPTRDGGRPSLDSHDVAVSLGLGLAQAVGCSDPTSANLAAVAECLRQAPAEALVRAAADLPMSMPVVDGTFLVEPPEKTLASGDYKRLRMLAGSNAGDGVLFPGIYWNTFSMGEDSTVNASTFEETVVEQVSKSADRAVLDAIAFEYTGTARLEDGVRNRDGVIALVRDYFFSCRADEDARQQTQGGSDAYMYLFTLRPSRSRLSSWIRGFHADEVQYVFGHPLSLNTTWKYEPEEKELSRAMMAFWTNFAKFGDPSRSESSSQSIFYWPKYDISSQKYLVFDTHLTVQPGPSMIKCDFLYEYLPKLLSDTTQTSSAEISRRIYHQALLLLGLTFSLSVNCGGFAINARTNKRYYGV